MGASGALSSSVHWKLTGRDDADGAYEVDNFYPDSVRRDQRTDLSVRDAYVDISAGDWDYRLGRQQIVWGEMVGFFFADVVSARDMREFLLPELESMRIPQWAARAEYFDGDFHAEFIWIPVASYDDVGKPGADFFPFPAAVPNHDAIQQAGGTVSKDFGDFVFKGEFVYTHGRSFNLFNESAPYFGMKSSDTQETVVGIDIPTGDWRINGQFFLRTLFGHDPAMQQDRNQLGASLLVNRKMGDAVETELMMATSLRQTDYMVRPKVIWRFAPSWRSQAGVDILSGRPQGFFGRFEDRSRAYMEVRRDF